MRSLYSTFQPTSNYNSSLTLNPEVVFEPLDASLIIAGFEKYSIQISQKQATKIIAECDMSRGRGKDGMISYDEFLFSLLNHRGGFYDVFYGEGLKD
ncbi:hypothetical protein TrVE_jg7332 [Triparma verrucosa]|uniref:EF-hand domain-containing protein n=1 Tax=Triparma verrucosa TaxID=1606542 RepID=A0A9W7FMJ9_9STRA|nr:hypothetical protein TrVE_jg7332 [Triparma verrucosa]